MTTGDWLHYAARTDVILLRLRAADPPREDRAWSSYAVADAEGVIRLPPLTPSRLEWFVQMEYERGRIYSAAEVHANRSCDCGVAALD